MPLSVFGFIVKGPGYKADAHNAQLSSGLFTTFVVGVADFAAAQLAAQALVTNGVQLIELCGGFTESEAAQMRQYIGPNVPIGVVVYSPAQATALANLFASS
jgi:hypothetical protein